MADEIAQRVWHGPRVEHGTALQAMCKHVETPYTLTLDNDIEFLAPVLDRLRIHLDREMYFAACHPDGDLGHLVYNSTSTFEDYFYRGVKSFGQPHINPCIALLQTRRLKSFLEYVSWESYFSPVQAKHYDTGSMLWHAAKAAGAHILSADWLGDAVRHIGSMTWDDQDGGKYAQIQERLKTYAVC